MKTKMHVILPTATYAVPQQKAPSCFEHLSHFCQRHTYVKGRWRKDCWHDSNRYANAPQCYFTVKYSPEQVLGDPEAKAPDFLDFRLYEGGKVVTLTHRPSLSPGVFLVLIFRGWVDPRAHGSVGSLEKKIPSDTTGDFLVLFLYFVLLCPDCPGWAFCPYCTTHTTQTSMPPVGFEPAISAGERLQTHA
jgi:hypothetical protein